MQRSDDHPRRLNTNATYFSPYECDPRHTLPTLKNPPRHSINIHSTYSRSPIHVPQRNGLNPLATEFNLRSQHKANSIYSKTQPDQLMNRNYVGSNCRLEGVVVMNNSVSINQQCVIQNNDISFQLPQSHSSLNDSHHNNPNTIDYHYNANRWSTGTSQNYSSPYQIYSDQQYPAEERRSGHLPSQPMSNPSAHQNCSQPDFVALKNRLRASGSMTLHNLVSSIYQSEESRRIVLHQLPILRYKCSIDEEEEKYLLSLCNWLSYKSHSARSNINEPNDVDDVKYSESVNYSNISLSRSIHRERCNDNYPRAPKVDHKIFELVLVHFAGINSEISAYQDDFRIICKDGVILANKDLLIANSSYFYRNINQNITTFISLTDRDSHQIRLIVRLITSGMVVILRKNVPAMKEAVKHFGILGVYFSNDLHEKNEANTSVAELPPPYVEISSSNLPERVKCLICHNILLKEMFVVHYEEYHSMISEAIVCCQKRFTTKYDHILHKKLGCCRDIASENDAPFGWSMENSLIQVNNDIERPSANIHSTPIEERR